MNGDLVWKGRNSGCIIEYGKGNKKQVFILLQKQYIRSWVGVPRNTVRFFPRLLDLFNRGEEIDV